MIYTNTDELSKKKTIKIDLRNIFLMFLNDPDMMNLYNKEKTMCM